MLRLSRTSPNGLFSTPRHLSSSPAEAADVSSIIALLLRPTEGDADRDTHDEDKDLRSLLSSAPYTPFHFLQVIRSLPDSRTALRFIHWCRNSQLPAASSLQVPYAYQALFELAAREEAPDTHLRMKELLDESIKSRYPLTIGSATLLVGFFGSAGMISDALLAFRRLRPSYRKTRICNRLLHYLLSSGNQDHRREAAVVVRDMIRAEPQCRPDALTGSIVYHGLEKRNRVIDEVGADLLVEMAEFGIFPSGTFLLARLISNAGRWGLVGKAWDILHAVKKAGGVVETPSYNALLTFLQKDGDFQRMNLLFSEMKVWDVKPDTFTYGILLNHLCKSHRVDDALKLLDEMQTKSTSDVVLFNTVINGLCKEGRLEEGLAMLDMMKSKHGCAPNTITYNSLINGFCKAGDIGLSNKLLARMKDEGVSLSAVTVNTMIDGMCRQGTISSALEFFRRQQLAYSGFSGNAITYTTMIAAFLHANNVDKARELFDEMLIGGHTPDAITYRTLISGLAQVGRAEEASSIASQMKKYGFQLDTRSYNILIHGFCKKKKLDKVHELLDEMKKAGRKPDEVTFNTLISSSSKAGDISTFPLLLKKMIDSGLKPSVITYGALIHGYCKVGNFNEAFKTLKTMIDAGISPSNVIYAIFIDFLSKENDVSSVLSLLDEMQAQGMQPSISTYNSVFRCLRDRNLLDEAYEVMDRMKEQGCNPNYITMEILTEWFSAVGEVARLKNFIQRKGS